MKVGVPSRPATCVLTQRHSHCSVASRLSCLAISKVLVVVPHMKGGYKLLVMQPCTIDPTSSSRTAEVLQSYALHSERSKPPLSCFIFHPPREPVPLVFSNATLLFQVAEMKAKLAELSDVRKAHLTRQADRMATDFEAQRELDSVCLVVDMDMFYAAVEIRSGTSPAKQLPFEASGFFFTINLFTTFFSWRHSHLYVRTYVHQFTNHAQRRKYVLKLKPIRFSCRGRCCCLVNLFTTTTLQIQVARNSIVLVPFLFLSLLLLTMWNGHDRACRFPQRSAGARRQARRGGR